MNRKALVDIFVLLVLLFTIAIVTFIAVTIYTEFYNAMPEGEIEREMLDKLEPAFTVQDIAYVLIVAGSIIALALSAFYIPSNPVYFFMSMIVLAFVVIIGAQFSNIFQQFYNSTTKINATATSFPMIVWIWEQMPIILLIGGFVFIIIFYAKTRGVGGEG